MIALVCWFSFRRHRRSVSERPLDQHARLLLDFGVAGWGLAYLLDAVADRDRGARLIDAHLFGAIDPIGIGIEWLGLACALAGVALWTAPRLPVRLREPGLLLSSVVALLVVGEGVVRILAVVDPASQGFPTYRGQLWTERHVSFNSLGFRGPEPRILRAPDGKRLVVIGDSFAFGAGVDDPADRIGEVLGRLLEQRTAEDWEAVNISRPDTHTLDHLEMLSVATRLDPDLVVLIYVFNDIDYLRESTERTVLTEHPRGLLDRLHPARLGFRNSYLYQQLFVEFRTLRYTVAPGERADPYLDPELLRTHLEDVANLVDRARDAAGVACVIPFALAVQHMDTARLRYDLFVRSARESGVPICGIEGAFEGWEISELVLNRHDAHPNARAHRLAAEAAIDPLMAIYSQAPP
ncbi:MAG: SGNH/GDSL hydrolase family protein [Actinomycetota bacterium]